MRYGRGVKGMSQKSVEKDRIKGIKIPDCFFIINVLQQGLGIPLTSVENMQ